MDYKNKINELKTKTLKAKKKLGGTKTSEKNKALELICESIIKSKGLILKANEKDIAFAKKNNLSESMIDRLKLSDSTLNSMIGSVKKIISLEDPVGSIDKVAVNDSGFKIGQMRSPLGVIFIIYESRPNVTLDAAALCLKSSNVSILRGGKEAIFSNLAIYQAIVEGLKKSSLDENSIIFIDDLSHNFVQELIKSDDFIDVIIPRGSKSLISAIQGNAKIPVIAHLDGNCHIYVDEYANLEMAKNIVFNAKTRRYGVCNALESLLIHKNIAAHFLPTIAKLFDEKGVEMRVCKNSALILEKNKIKHTLATDDDYFTEFLAPIIAIKITDGLDEAINHINYYGSKHTDAIITENLTNSEQFLTQVDSSSVMVNVSTAFGDGFEYGLGAEIGISTNKLHVRGPVGLVGLTNQKYVIFGSGQTRA